MKFLRFPNLIIGLNLNVARCIFGIASRHEEHMISSKFTEKNISYYYTKFKSALALHIVIPAISYLRHQNLPVHVHLHLDLQIEQ